MAILQCSTALVPASAAEPCVRSPLSSASSLVQGRKLPLKLQQPAQAQAQGVARRGPLRLRAAHGASGMHCAGTVLVKESYGTALAQGKARQVMEDRVTVQVDASGKDPSFFAVFDGHGGDAVAQLLTKELWAEYQRRIQKFPDDLEKASVQAFYAVDQLTLQPPKGLFGALRERGVGGSKCGSCANSAVLLPTPSGGLLLVAANVGDSRTVLCREGQALQLSIDHKPDVEEERLRIERKNPTPLKPLVRKAGGEWRVGGLLALSRAFGDAYLKDWDDGTRDGARGGFGLTAEPSVFVEEISGKDQWLILGTDGLWDHVANQEAVGICLAEGGEKTPEQLAQQLLKLAVSKGSTDDVSVIVVKLSA